MAGSRRAGKLRKRHKSGTWSPDVLDVGAERRFAE
jgi:hypothetical protein